MTRTHGLLSPTSTDRLRSDTRQALDLVTEVMTSVRRPATGASAAASRRLVGSVDLDSPLPGWTDVLHEVRGLYLDDAVWFHHPRYVAHLNCPVAVPAVAADLLATAVNTSMDTWDQSTGATTIERRLVAWTAGRLGLGDDADGVFTSGGSQSNLQAMLLAREAAVARHGAGESRHEVLPRLRVLASADAHFSVRKACALLGLADDAVVTVPVNAERRMSVHALRRALVEVAAADLLPMAVVATAGTTDFGAIDPLTEVAEACRAPGAWLHVDAAYGGGLVTSRRHRHLLDGIGAADSVTVDFHKTFFQPVAASAVLVRDARSLRHVTWHADYLNPAGVDPDERPNLVDRSLQTTRRFDALKLWCTLRALGPDAIGAMLDDVIALARQGYDVLAADEDFEVAARPALSTLVFRYAPPGLTGTERDLVNGTARDSLWSSGEAVVAGTKVDGEAWLKVTLLNPATTVDDLRVVLDLLRGHAARAWRERSDGAERRAS